jgi:hypothetical protein
MLGLLGEGPSACPRLYCEVPLVRSVQARAVLAGPTTGGGLASQSMKLIVVDEPPFASFAKKVPRAPA